MDKRTVILLLVMAALAVGSAVPTCRQQLAERSSAPRADRGSTPSQSEAASGDASAVPSDTSLPSPLTRSGDDVTTGRQQVGRDMMIQYCYGTCHSGSVVLEAHLPPSDWEPTVDRMIRHGMRIEPYDREVLVDFLVTLP